MVDVLSPRLSASATCKGTYFNPYVKTEINKNKTDNFMCEIHYSVKNLG